MKKLSMIVAALAIFSTVILSSIKYKSTPLRTTKQKPYVWIRYDCGSWGKAQTAAFSIGINAIQTNEHGIPSIDASHPCGAQGTNVHAVRFQEDEFEPIMGYYGHLKPKSHVDPWDGKHLVAYCN